MVVIITPDGRVFRITEVLDNGTVKMKEYADDGSMTGLKFSGTIVAGA